MLKITVQFAGDACSMAVSKVDTVLGLKELIMMIYDLYDKDLADFGSGLSNAPRVYGYDGISPLSTRNIRLVIKQGDKTFASLSNDEQVGSFLRDGKSKIPIFAWAKVVCDQTN